MQQASIDALWTRLRVCIDDEDTYQWSITWKAIEQFVWEFDARYSRFRPWNWLHSLNKNRSGILDEHAHAMLDFSLRLAKLTEWRFDPTIWPRLSALGYWLLEEADFSSSSVPGYTQVHIEGNRVWLEGNSKIEFGWVGKGYALDVIASILAPYPRFLIDFWGDIFARWGWKVGLEHPNNPSLAVGYVELENGSLCASSGYKRKFGTSHHILDARKGESTSHVWGTFIEAPCSLVADWFATVCHILPPEESTALFSQKVFPEFPAFEGVVFEREDRAFQSSGSKISLFTL